MDNPQASEDLATINATEWFEELKADNEALKKAFTERVKTTAVKKVPTDAVAMKGLTQALNLFITVINAAQIHNQIIGIEKTIDMLNEAISGALASARQSASSGRQQQPDRPGAADEPAEA